MFGLNKLLNLPFCWRNFKRFGYISACESGDKDEAEENKGKEDEYCEVSHGHLVSFIHDVFFVSILFLYVSYLIRYLIRLMNLHPGASMLWLTLYGGSMASDSNTISAVISGEYLR